MISGLFHERIWKELPSYNKLCLFRAELRKSSVSCLVLVFNRVFFLEGNLAASNARQHTLLFMDMLRKQVLFSKIPHFEEYVYIYRLWLSMYRDGIVLESFFDTSNFFCKWFHLACCDSQNFN